MLRCCLWAQAFDHSCIFGHCSINSGRSPCGTAYAVWLSVNSRSAAKVHQAGVADMYAVSGFETADVDAYAQVIILFLGVSCEALEDALP